MSTATPVSSAPLETSPRPAGKRASTTGVAQQQRQAFGATWGRIQSTIATQLREGAA